MWIAITSRCLPEKRVSRLGMQQAERAVVATHLNVYRLSLWYILSLYRHFRLALIRMRETQPDGASLARSLGAAKLGYRFV